MADCVECENGAQICGPGVGQGDCPPFNGVESEDDGKGANKCPEGWCFVEMCQDEAGDRWSIWKPTTGSCIRMAMVRARTKYLGWHRKCDC